MNLEGLKEKVIRDAGESSDNFPESLLEFVSASLKIPVKYFENAEWTLVVEAFYFILLKSPSIKLPITSPSGEKSKPEDWDYEGRTWHLYAYMIAKAYGWTFEYISQLQVRDALATIQEILTDRQLEREFYYSLSEVAYPYDKNTKKSHYSPMPRPHWMRPQIKPIKKFPMPKSTLPMGVVNYNALPEELRPKELVH